MHLCVSALTGLSHSNWLFIHAVMLAARAAVSRREATGPGRLKITKTQSKGIVFGEFLPPS